jgi:hypothetical protein
VKNVLSSQFARDAYDWIELYFLSLPKDYQSISLMSKRFMNLRMALECLLKSMLIELSDKNETAKNAYSVCKNCGHNLEKLANECKQRSHSKFRICNKTGLIRLRQMNHFHIGLRYDIDLKEQYRKEDIPSRFTATGKITGVLQNDDFHKELLKDLSFMFKQNRRIYKWRFAKHKYYKFSRYREILKYIETLTLT